MIEFLVKKTYKFRRDLEDEDYRNLAQQISSKWADYCFYSNVSSFPRDKLKSWMRVQEVISNARFFHLMNSEFARYLSAWLKESEFVGQVPSDVAKEYQVMNSLDPRPYKFLPKSDSRRYSLEQYFVYKEVCKAFGVDPYAQDVK